MTSTIDTQSLESLLERVRAATGPDRELDAIVICALMAPPSSWVEQSNINGAWCIYEGYSVRVPNRPRLWGRIRWSHEQGRLITSSLDACAALQVEVLPNCGRVVHAAESDAPICVEIFRLNRIVAIGEGWHRNECLAWLAAILSALIAKGGADA